jgi:iron complex outermembrane receptor protein
MASYYRNLVDSRITHDLTSAGIGFVVSPVTGLTMKANYGRHYRVPTLMELFGYRSVVLPNPGLEPETGLNRDLGIAYERKFAGGGFISAEYARFWSDVDRLIMFAYVPFAQASQAINIDRAEIEGHEVALVCGSLYGFSLSGNLTLLEAINTGPISYLNGKRLPNRPGTEASVDLRWSRSEVSVIYEFDYIGGNYWNAYNGKAPNNKGPLFSIRRLHNISVTLPTGVPRTDLTLEVRNVADERFEDVMGYPLPGRSIAATLLYEI